MSGIYVSMTGFRPKDAAQLPRFWWHTLRSMAQARRAAGNLGLAARVIRGTYHTMTIWLDDACTRSYVTSGPHRSAMRNFRSIGSGKTYGFHCSDYPNWDSVYALWIQYAKDV